MTPTQQHITSTARYLNTVADDLAAIEPAELAEHEVREALTRAADMIRGAALAVSTWDTRPAPFDRGQDGDHLYRRGVRS